MLSMSSSSKKALSLLLCLLLPMLARTTVAQQQEDECGLYLAVSSTSTVEEPKWGVYAGHQGIPQDTPVGGYGDVAVHTFHLFANAVLEGEAESDDPNPLAQVVDYFEQYIWVPNSSGGQYELEQGRIVTAIAGAGVLGAFNPRLTNADWHAPSAYHRTAWNEVAQSAHPGRGAYSSYYNVTLHAMEDIPAGMEVFINYGDNWEAENDGDNAEITKADHAKIDQTIVKMIDFFDKHGDALDPTSKQEIYHFLINDVLSAAAGPRKAQKIVSMLPEDPADLPKIMQDGGIVKLTSPASMRNMEWLQKHGRCMDNIRPGPSTIPHAGRGAFANRKISAGGLVAPVPLIQIPDREILDMHEVVSEVDDENEEWWSRASNDVVGHQLLLNYCWGHAESSLLFFPTGASAALINHSDEPNAKMVWSKHPNHHQHWLELEPDQLISEDNSHLGLLMEIVALRDISEGEEVFIDYGNEWKEAWAEHVEAWKAAQASGDLPKDKEWPLRALDVMEEHRTKGYSKDQVLPDNIMMKCFLMVKKPEDEPPVNTKGEKIRLWSDQGKTLRSENLFDCTVESSKPDADELFLYTIKWTGQREVTIVKEVPHKAIALFDKSETSDQHIPQGFRHYVGIPDDVFPQGPWRNLEDEESADEEEA